MSWQSWTTVRSTRSIGNRWWTGKAASESFSTTASFGCTPGISVTHSARPFFSFSSKPRFQFQWRFTSPKFGAAIKYHHVISRVYRVFMGFLCSKSMSVHVSPAGPSEWWWIPQGALTSPLRSQCPWWLKRRETKETLSSSQVYGKTHMETWRIGILSSSHIVWRVSTPTMYKVVAQKPSDVGWFINPINDH